MRLRKATESEYSFYARWRDIIYSIPFSSRRPTSDVIEYRRINRHLKKLETAKELTLKERQSLNKAMKKREARKRLKYSIDGYISKVNRNEIMFIEEDDVVIGYVEIRPSPKGFFRIVDWALSGEFQNLEYMNEILEELKKKAGKRKIYILTGSEMEGWCSEALRALGFYHEKLEWKLKEAEG